MISDILGSSYKTTAIALGCSQSCLVHESARYRVVIARKGSVVVDKQTATVYRNITTAWKALSKGRSQGAGDSGPAQSCSASRG